MKTLNLWKTLLCATMMLALGGGITACSDDEDDPIGAAPEMTLSAESLLFDLEPAEAKSFDIQMKGSGFWRITGDTDKMDVQPLSGNKSAKVSVKPMATPTPRNLSLTVTLYQTMYGVEVDVMAKTVKITQNSGEGPIQFATNVKEIRAKVDEWCPTKGATYNIEEDLVLTGIVVSDKEGGNTNARNVLLADNTTEPGAGIMIRAKKYPDQVRGHVVSVNLNGAVAQNYNGTMQVEFQEGGAAGGAASFTVVDDGDNLPEAIEVTDVKTLINYQSQYVKVKAQAKEADFGKMFYAGSENYCNYTFVTPTGASLPLQFSSYSKSWAGSIAIPEKSGYIKGCVGTYDGGNIAPQNADDVAGLTEELFEVEPGPGPVIPTDAIYSNNFDKVKAEKVDNYWPLVSATDCYQNQGGSGAANVTYAASSKTSVRPTMTSEGAAYGGSGVNAIFFGEDNGTFTIGNIAVATEKLKLTFGVSKANSTAFTAVAANEFTVALSADGEKWSNSVNYTLSGETDAWNLGTADFTLPAGTKTLHIKFTAAVKSVYRLDDVTLAAGEGGQTISFDGGSEPDPGPDPDVDITPLSTVLALSNGASIPAKTVVEAVVISNAELNNLTSKKGAYVQDATGGLQLRFTADHTFKFGDKLRIDLSGIAMGEYGGAVQVSVDNSKATLVSSDNAVEAKTVSIDDFLANKYEGQYVAIDDVQVSDLDLDKTWVFGGKHSNIAMTSKSGRTFVVFSSKYATYGATNVAQGSGTIKGISAINNSVMQIIFAQESDFAGLTGERFGGSTPTPDPDPTPNPSGTVVFDFTTGYTDLQSMDNVPITVDGLTVKFDKADASTAPTYYDNGTSVRLYGGSTMNLSGAKFSKVEFTFDTRDKANNFIPDSGTYEAPVWTGETDNLTITVDGTTGHRRIQVITVTLGDGSENPTPDPGPVVPDPDTNAVELTLKNIVAAGVTGSSYTAKTFTDNAGNAWDAYAIVNAAYLQFGWNTDSSKAASQCYLKTPVLPSAAKKVTITPANNTIDGRVFVLLPADFKYNGESVDDIKTKAYAVSAPTVKGSTEPITFEAGKAGTQFIIRAVGGAAYVTNVKVEY